jgi:probable rRNA maturation factor
MLALQLAPDLDIDAEVSAELERAAARMVIAAGLGDLLDEEPEVTLRLVGDGEIRELNRSYRGRDAATDVLAFAIREGPAGEALPSLLGDIVISVDTAARQARGSLSAELLDLFAHGLCHLLGYDHQSDREETEMNARARRLLAEARREGEVGPA